MSHATATMIHDAISKVHHPDASFTRILPNGYKLKYLQPSRLLSVSTVIPGSIPRKMVEIIRISGKDNTIIFDAHGLTHAKIYKACNSILTVYGLPTCNGKVWSDGFLIVRRRTFMMHSNPLPARLQVLPKPPKPERHVPTAQNAGYFRLIKRKPAAPQP